MNEQKLPNATASLVLGIISIVCLCCFGPFSVITGGIGFFLARKDEALYQQNPSSWSNFQNVKTGKILSLIGLILGVLSTAWLIYNLATIGVDGYKQMVEEAMKGAQAK